ncbi:hypothetical protein PMAYCL1PPCAC_24667, partial [Pristionchus mayeri]
SDSHLSIVAVTKWATRGDHRGNERERERVRLTSSSKEGRKAQTWWSPCLQQPQKRQSPTRHLRQRRIQQSTQRALSAAITPRTIMSQVSIAVV